MNVSLYSLYESLLARAVARHDAIAKWAEYLAPSKRVCDAFAAVGLPVAVLSGQYLLGFNVAFDWLVARFSLNPMPISTALSEAAMWFNLFAIPVYGLMVIGGAHDVSGQPIAVNDVFERSGAALTWGICSYLCVEAGQPPRDRKRINIRVRKMALSPSGL